ncbi:ParB N-terminal domain-containing protein [Clostridioides difficile]|nr:ParB N-terminal domain-containing protein [Clostridioides difficile]
MNKREVVYLNLEDIKPYQNNPRRNDEAIEKVIKSIDEFGFTNPILVDEDNIIIAGHTRYEASKQLELKQVPCIVLKNLTEEQIKAYRLIDTAIFITIGFWGTVPSLITMIMSQYVVKFFLALADTPFFYLLTRNKEIKVDKQAS